MNTMIAPGTPCFLVRLAEHTQLVGCVVEVIAGPMSALGDAGDDWYRFRASWVLESLNGCEAMARRGNLLPITPPLTALAIIEKIRCAGNRVKEKHG